MNNYQIFSDTSVDLSPEVLKGWGVPVCQLRFTIDDNAKLYTNDEVSPQEVYQKLRNGSMIRTTGANPEDFQTQFRTALDQGKDVLYLAFSSGLSMTYQSSVIAAEELREEYPDRKIIVIDTGCASAGVALLLHLTLEQQQKGKTIDEAADFVEKALPHVCHWFTVDSLKWLKAGGRVSATAAFVAGVLDIKPVLHVDDEGKLIPMAKVRGRKASIKGIAKQLFERMLCLRDTQDETIPEDLRNCREIFISHGDCVEDAELLADMIEKETGIKTTLITYIGPVIGGHAGPGTLALFFIGESR